MPVLLSRASKGFAALRRRLLSWPFFTSTILARMPRRLRWGLRRAYFAPLDLLERLQGERDPMVPPHADRFTGSAGDDFVSSALDLVRALELTSNLTSESKVLDIGCGIGRLAVPLTKIITPPGSYDGLDIVEAGITWCTERITPRFPHFTFTLADVANVEYHPGGSISAAEYSLPYPDGHFDIVVLYSVFTHMRPAEMERYVSEISRVLSPSGHVLATYLIVNDESRTTMDAGKAMYNFTHHEGNHWFLTNNMKSPELGVAYDEQYVREVFAQNGLDIAKGIYFGAWSGLPARSSDGEPVLYDLMQDAVVGIKR